MVLGYHYNPGKLQCNVVFSGKFRLLIKLNLSVAQTLQLVLSNCVNEVIILGGFVPLASYDNAFLPIK